MSPRETGPDLSHAGSSCSLATDYGDDDCKIEVSSAEASSTKTVSFGSVRVREYIRIVGDNPEVKVGPPISIGWDYMEREDQTLEEYEASKRGGKRRLLLSSITRKNLLHNVFGIAEEEIRDAEKEIQKIRRQRAQTVKLTKAGETVEGAMQSFRRKLRRSSESFLHGLTAASGQMMMPISMHA
jgi:hypothetical protein